MVSFESLKSEYERNWANLEIRPSRLADANGGRTQGDQRQGDLSADRAVDRSPLVFRRALPLPRIQLRFRHLSRQRRNASSRDDASFRRGAVPLPRSWTAPWTRSESRISSAPTTGASRGCCSGSRRSTASAITRRAAIRPISMAVRRCTARPRRGPANSSATTCSTSDHVDSQLGTAVILHAMMSLDSSITLDGSPQFAGRTEPEDDAASTIVLMQQALNKLGANPPLAEDGISGPKTRAAVSQFQQQNGLRDTGLLDGATVAALTRATQAGGTGRAAICPGS